MECPKLAVCRLFGHHRAGQRKVHWLSQLHWQCDFLPDDSIKSSAFLSMLGLDAVKKTRSHSLCRVQAYQLQLYPPGRDVNVKSVFKGGERDEFAFFQECRMRRMRRMRECVDGCADNRRVRRKLRIMRRMHRRDAGTIIDCVESVRSSASCCWVTLLLGDAAMTTKTINEDIFRSNCRPPVHFEDHRMLQNHNYNYHAELSLEHGGSKHHVKRQDNGFLKCPLCDHEMRTTTGLRAHVQRHHDSVSTSGLA